MTLALVSEPPQGISADLPALIPPDCTCLLTEAGADRAWFAGLPARVGVRELAASEAAPPGACVVAGAATPAAFAAATAAGALRLIVVAPFGAPPVPAPPAPWRLVERRLSGAFLPAHADPAAGLRSRLAAEIGGGEGAGLLLDRVLDTLAADRWWGGPPPAAGCDRSHLLSVYATQGEALGAVALSPVRAGFTDALQEDAGFPAAPAQARYRLGGSAVRTAVGVAAGEANLAAWVEVAFAARPRRGDRLVIEGRGPAEAPCRVVTRDLRTHQNVVLGAAAFAGETASLTFADEWPAAAAGFVVRIELSPGAVLTGAAFEAAGDRPAVPVGEVTLAELAQRLDAWDAGTAVAAARLANAVRKLEREKAVAEANVTRLLTSLDAKEAARDAAESAFARQGALLAAVRGANRRRVRRVLVISHMYPHEQQPSSGVFIQEQVRALMEHEHLDVRVISPRPYWMNTPNPVRVLRGLRRYRWSGGRLAWREDAGIYVANPPYIVGGYFKHQVHALTYYLAVRRVISRAWQDFKFDLVHAHTGYLDAFAGVQVARRYRVPCIVTEHTGPFTTLTGKPVVRQFTLSSLGKASRVVCVSDALRAEVSGYYPPAEAKRFTTLHNGVDVELFRPPEVWAPDPARPKLLFTGALDDWKNPLLLLDAFAELTKTVPGATLKLVGVGPLKAAVEARAAEFGGAVEVLGHVDRAGVARLMRDACDVFVLPSRGETFGVVLIEALASGKPVVATDRGGPNDIVREPWQGRLCAMADPAVLAAALRETVAALPTFSAERIRSYAVDTFAYRNIARQLTELYEETVG